MSRRVMDIVKANGRKLAGIDSMLAKASRVIEQCSGIDKNTEISNIKDSKLFVDLTEDLTSAQRGLEWEKHICSKLNGISLKSSKDMGDFVTEQYGVVECKISTNKNGILNMRQLRLWQDIDTYIFAHIDYDNPSNSNFFTLTKKQVERQCVKHGGFMHGTKEVNRHNKNSMMSLSVNTRSKRSKKTKEWFDSFKNDELKNQFFI